MKDIDFAALERLTVEGAKSVLSSLGIKMKAKAKKTELRYRMCSMHNACLEVSSDTCCLARP